MVASASQDWMSDYSQKWIELYKSALLELERSLLTDRLAEARDEIVNALRTCGSCRVCSGKTPLVVGEN
jgi:hypothetical protein